MKQSDFIPRPDAEFNIFYKNIVDYVAAHSINWSEIPAVSVKELRSQYYDKWEPVYEAVLTPHIAQLTKEKNRIRAQSERSLRDFVNRFLRWPPVTDLDRNSMGIRNRKTVRTARPVPVSKPELEANTSVIRQISLRMRDNGATGWGKPVHVHHIQIAWNILDAPPDCISGLAHFETATANPIVLSFDEHQRGKRLYYAARWVNNTSKAGPWSEIHSSIIP